MNADVAEELRFHIEVVTDELVAEGWTRETARAEALRRFGDIGRIGGECVVISRSERRRRRRRTMWQSIVQDARHAIRSLRRSPGFALVAVATLAVGIGATTAIFTIVDGVLLRPLPFAEADRLYLIFERNVEQGIEQDVPSGPNFLDWRASSRMIGDMAALRDVSMTLTGRDRAEVLQVAGATANFLDVLGVTPILGRGFQPADDAGETRRVAMLSHASWQQLYGGDPGVIGRSIVLDGVAHEVVGVMGPRFHVPREGIQVWVPYNPQPEHRQSRYLTVIARLADGVSEAQATAEMEAIGARLAEAYPEANRGFVPYLVSARDRIVGDAQSMILIVFGAVAFVFLLSCTNVASLVLGRATSREGELAVRTALGATRSRLRGQLITENVILGFFGGAVGSLLAWWGVKLFLATGGRALPRADELSVDWRVLVFALAVSLLAGVGLAVMPSVRASRAGFGDTLRDGGTRTTGGRRREMARRVLIVTEVAASMILLVGAGLALRSLSHLRAIDPGYATENIIVSYVSLSGAKYDAGPLARRNALKVRYFEDLLERVRSLPGVRSAGITSTLPLRRTGIDFDLAYRAQGQPDLPEGQLPQVDYRIISPGYLEAMGIELVRGRALEEVDRAGSRPVILMNEEFASQLWPGEDPIGRTLKVYYVEDTEWEVAGIVANTRHRGLAEPARAQIFVPLAQAEMLFGYMTVVVRTSGTTPGLADAMRDAAAAIDPDEPLYSFDTIETVMADATLRDRLAAFVFGTFAIIAIVLAAAGIYGVISYQVAARTREIGVRMALGASRRRVLSSVVGEAAALAVAGIAIGLAAAGAAARLAAGQLHGVGARDPVTLGSVSALLFLVAVSAALVPALRAASVPPVQALRGD